MQPDVLDHLLNSRHGVVSSAELVDVGVTRGEVDRAIRAGRLRRIRRGWVAAAWADPDVVGAVELGGCLSCVTALRRHGVWVPEHRRRIHVRGTDHGRRSHAHDFCTWHGRPEVARIAVDDLASALRCAVRCLDDEGIVVVGDSILNRGLMSADELASTLRRAPGRIHDLLARCDAGADSGTETMSRLRLRARGMGVRVQPFIPTVGWVDLLIGNRLLLEIDGREFHGVERFEADRTRDRRSAGIGYLTLRLSYNQVVHGWPEAEDDLMRVIRRGEHLGHPLVPPTMFGGRPKPHRTGPVRL